MNLKCFKNNIKVKIKNSLWSTVTWGKVQVVLLKFSLCKNFKLYSLDFMLPVFYRLESSFRSFSRPVLHAAARVVQEMGKSRAAAFAIGIPDIDEAVHVNTFSESLDSQDYNINETAHPESKFPTFLSFDRISCKL